MRGAEMNIFNPFLTLPIVALPSLLTVTADALAQGGRNEGWQMGPGMMDGWGMGWFGGIFMVIFWILILVGLVFVIRWLFQATSKKGDSSQQTSRAIDILKERYARGEIDKTQFEDMNRDLTG
jgi:putative membrane protein